MLHTRLAKFKSGGGGYIFGQDVAVGIYANTPRQGDPKINLHGLYFFCYSSPVGEVVQSFTLADEQPTQRPDCFSVPFIVMSMHITPDKTVPYPESLEPEVASTLRENMQIASNTAEVLKALGAQVDDDPEAQDKADNVFKDFAERAKQQYEQITPAKRGPGRPRKETSASPPTLYELPVAERIGNMLREYNNEFVADASQLRQVVTNKLLDLASCGDPKIEIKATEMLGKISDVGLFSEKTEISVTYNNSADLDQAIKDNVRKLMRLYGGRETAVDVDLDKEFGPTLELEMVEDVTPVPPVEPVPPAEDIPNAQ